MTILWEKKLHTLGETLGEAALLASFLKVSDILLLEGELGVGKTTFAQKVIRTLSGDETLFVPSPTFNLVQVYETTQGPLWHVDLYRLTQEETLHDLGLDEAFSTNICLIEWPDRLGPLWPAEGLHLCLTMDQDAATRNLIVQGGESWKRRLSGQPCCME